MDFDYSIIEINKYVAGLGNWFPGSNLYMGLYTALSGIAYTSGNKIGVNEANYSGYGRVTIPSGNWNIQYLAGSSRLNNTNTFSFNNYPYTAPVVAGYFISDVETGSGVIISHGSLTYGATLGQTIDLSFSGVYLAINQGQSTSSLSVYGAINITPTGTRLLFDHLRGVRSLEPLSFRPVNSLGNEFGNSFSISNLAMATSGNNYIHNTTGQSVSTSGDGEIIWYMNMYLGNEKYGVFNYDISSSQLIGRMDCGGTFIMDDIPANTYSNVYFPFISFNILYD